MTAEPGGKYKTRQDESPRIVVKHIPKAFGSRQA